MSHTERIAAAAAAACGLSLAAQAPEAVHAAGRYTVECRGADGQLKWSDSFSNLVTTAGKNDLLDKYLGGAAYTAAWFIGLIDSVSYSAVAAGDTASSHAGWIESVAYSNATRPAPSWGAAASSTKASTATGFTVNATATIKGAFLISNSTKGGTSGLLYSAGLFSGGDRAVVGGDTLNVTYTASA